MSYFNKCDFRGIVSNAFCKLILKSKSLFRSSLFSLFKNINKSYAFSSKESKRLKQKREMRKFMRHLTFCNKVYFQEYFLSRQWKTITQNLIDLVPVGTPSVSSLHGNRSTCINNKYYLVRCMYQSKTLNLKREDTDTCTWYPCNNQKHKKHHSRIIGRQFCIFIH